MILEWLTLLVLVVASAYDIGTRQIPNFLSVGLFMFLCVMWLLTQPPESWGQALGGVGISCVLLGPLFYARILGGGDVKLLLSLGLLVGGSQVFELWFWVALIGAGQALWFLWWKPHEKNMPYALSITLGFGVWLIRSIF